MSENCPNIAGLSYKYNEINNNCLRISFNDLHWWHLNRPNSLKAADRAVLCVGFMFMFNNTKCSLNSPRLSSKMRSHLLIFDIFYLKLYFISETSPDE